ncbi:hypothetical protein H6P81_007700 [Aristolochia fimbriata]|uniref:Uncharacterized protein n=1 Tax=Aristolochia fimbriata TaxID=158543 RepID=A0AAV7F3T8_ARIFI|nr:hypothetical protein H6P81_007700 [Aristolochia fimbriata]
MADNVDEIPATSSDVPGENSAGVETAGNSDAAEGDPSDKREESTETEGGEAEKKLEEAKEEGKDAETYREVKRRKNCPAALERSPSDRGFSFSFAFDTSVCHNDSTPKFGSFNFGNGAEQGLPAPMDFAGTPVGTRLGFLEKEEAQKEKIVADSAPVVREERKRKSTC